MIYFTYSCAFNIDAIFHNCPQTSHLKNPRFNVNDAQRETAKRRHLLHFSFADDTVNFAYKRTSTAKVTTVNCITDLVLCSIELT